MTKLTLALIAGGLATALFSAPAAAESHKDAVRNACQAGGGGAQACACVAERYAQELGAQELAFYVRAHLRGGDAQAVMAELGLTPAQALAIARKQRDLDARARRDCGLPERS